MYTLTHHSRKLDQIQPGIQESFPIAIQAFVTFFILNIMVFYYEWRLGLYLLGNWPLVMISNVVLRQVILFLCIIVYPRLLAF